MIAAFFFSFPKHTSKILWLHILLEEKKLHHKSSEIGAVSGALAWLLWPLWRLNSEGTQYPVPQAPRNQEMMMVLAMMVDHPLKQFYQKYTRGRNEIDMSTRGFVWLGRTSSTKLPGRGWGRLPRFIQHRLILIPLTRIAIITPFRKSSSFKKLREWHSVSPICSILALILEASYHTSG